MVIPTNMTPQPLPTCVQALLEEQNASPRLKAHLAVVRDVACVLTECIGSSWPMLQYNADAVLLGAAIHDIGKVIHPEELSEPGHAHEKAGRQLLLKNGWPEGIARFAVSHADWHAPDNHVEDLVVALADKIWKGKRDDELEQALTQLIQECSGGQIWEVWLRLDDILSEIAATAHDRLKWQAGYEV